VRHHALELVRLSNSRIPVVAHGALALTTPGDTSMATLAEVRRLTSGGTARAALVAG
jgi:hypothetical protein